MLFSTSLCKTVFTFNCIKSSLRRGFKSIYSLDKLYPNSSLNISKPPVIPQPTEDKFSGYIPIKDLVIKYSQSSNPEGQHINKLNTNVHVRFNLSSAKWISQRTKEKLAKMHEHNITKEGHLLVNSEKTKSQILNLADCMDKIRCYIREVEKEPPVIPPETKKLMKARMDRALAERLRRKRSC